MTKVRILSAITSNSGVTLFLDNDQELNLKKDTARTKQLLDDMIVALERKELLEIDLATFAVEKTIEEKTKGVVKFMRGKFSQLKAMFGANAAEPTMTTVKMGTLDKPTAGPDKIAITGSETLSDWRKAPINTPIGTPQSMFGGSISARKVSSGEPAAPAYEPEALHAVVAGKVIPDVEALTPYMDAINTGEDVVGFQRFMERIAAVIDTRTHSVKELLNFMRRGDLPIADDGSIVAYKVLNTASNNNGFVDCHSGKVTQKLGSFVQMDEKLVDPNRRNECSTGLHIARRGYLKGFRGNIITLVKVAPEDVIAVPPGEPDKMRAKGYHIVAVLPADVHALLRADKSMTGNEKAAKLLADVVKGNHTPILEIVNIGAAKGGDVTVTPVEGAKKMPRAAIGTSGTLRSLDDRPLAPEEEKANVSIKDLRRRVDEIAVDRLKAAAANGDMSAALKVTPSKVEQKVGRAKSATTPKAPVKIVDHTAPGAEKLTEKQQRALELHEKGLSNRQIEAEIHMCRKTLKKLFDKRGLTPNG